MTYKSPNPMPSHSTRRTGTRASLHHHRPPSPPPPSPSAPPRNYSLRLQNPPSTPDYIASSPPLEINQAVNITVEVTSSSATAYNGYDVRNYALPVTTTCYSTEPSSSASTSSYQYNMYESISDFPNHSFNPPSYAGTITTSSSSSPLQGHTPSTSSAASANYSHASEGYASEWYGSQSEYSDSQQPQENQTGRRRQSTRSHSSIPRRGQCSKDSSW